MALLTPLLPSRYAQYSSFKIHSEADYYRLEIDGYEGNAGDALSDLDYGSNNIPFSTHNRDNDRSSLNCASMLKVCWWSWDTCVKSRRGFFCVWPLSNFIRINSYVFTNLILCVGRLVVQVMRPRTERTLSGWSQWHCIKARHNMVQMAWLGLHAEECKDDDKALEQDCCQQHRMSISWVMMKNKSCKYIRKWCVLNVKM